MTTDGQIISLHCETGQAATMLNNIANWTQCDIFANTNTTWTYWYWITSSNEITPSVWNQNQKYVSWTDAEGGSMRGTNRYFEFTTTHAQNYRWVLYNHTSD